MIVDAAWYVDGKRDAGDRLDREAGGRAGRRGVRAGSGCGCRPTTSSTQVRDAFDLPELAIADARHKHDRPKVERHDDCLLTVVPTARYVDEREEVEFGELFLYAGRDYIADRALRPGRPAGQACATSWRQHPEATARTGPGAVLQAALLHVVRVVRSR